MCLSNRASEGQRPVCLSARRTLKGNEPKTVPAASSEVSKVWSRRVSRDRTGKPGQRCPGWWSAARSRGEPEHHHSTTTRLAAPAPPVPSRPTPSRLDQRTSRSAGQHQDGARTPLVRPGRAGRARSPDATAGLPARAPPPITIVLMSVWRRKVPQTAAATVGAQGLGLDDDVGNEQHKKSRRESDRIWRPDRPKAVEARGTIRSRAARGLPTSRSPGRSRAATTTIAAAATAWSAQDPKMSASGEPPPSQRDTPSNSNHNGPRWCQP